MNDRPPVAPPRRSSLARDVAVLVLTGLALGLGFNALQAAQDSPRALSWVRREPKLASFESLAGQLPPAASVPAAASPAERAPAEADETPAPVATAAATKPTPAPATKGAAKPATPAPGAKPASPAAPPPQSESPGHAATEAPEGAPPAAAAVPLPEVPVTREPLEVGLDFTKRFFEARAAVFVDARSAEEFAEGHIAGATSLPFDDVYKKPELAKQFDEHGVPIVVYCGGGDCDLARTLAYALIEAGHKRVLVFKDGYPGWAAAGLPVAKGAKP